MCSRKETSKHICELICTSKANHFNRLKGWNLNFIPLWLHLQDRDKDGSRCKFSIQFNKHKKFIRNAIKYFNIVVDGALVNRISIKCSCVLCTWLFHVCTFDETPKCKIHSFAIELLKLNNTFILVGNLKQSLVDDNDECVCVFDLH